LAGALRERGLNPRVIWDPAERRDALGDSTLRSTCLCVVVAGGDGTVADVINERPPVPLAVMPLGTENLFAREFGATRDEAALAQAIVNGRSRTIDLARAGTRLFSMVLGAGFDAEVVRRLARWRNEASGLKRASYFSYARPILAALARYPFPPIEIDADGVRVRGAQLLVFNLPQYGMRLPLAPDARGDDGLLDWVVFERPGWSNLLKYFWAARRCRHLRRPDVRHGQARHIRIRSDEAVPLQIDGDAAGCTPVEVSIVPQALRVIVP
jgi:YegS/Rv2252/BmrU family lipid kinase